MKLQRYGNSLLKPFVHADNIAFYCPSFIYDRYQCNHVRQYCSSIIPIYREWLAPFHLDPAPVGLLRLLSNPWECTPSDASTTVSIFVLHFISFPALMDSWGTGGVVMTLKGLSNSLIFWLLPWSCFRITRQNTMLADFHSFSFPFIKSTAEIWE